MEKNSIFAIDFLQYWLQKCKKMSVRLADSENLCKFTAK